MSTVRKGTALVTGGARRIGLDIAIQLSLLGFRVALRYNKSKTEALQAQKDIVAIGGSCELFSCDLNDPKETGGLIKTVRKQFPDLQLLINNASVFERASLTDFTSESFDKHMSVNLKAPMILIKDFAKICKAGHIINIIDTNYVKNQTSHLTYLLSKKGLADITKIAALELAPDIRVNAIAPGYILPPEDVGRLSMGTRTKSIPLQAQGDITSATRTIEFLVSNPYVTGQTIFIDGGEHLV